MSVISSSEQGHFAPTTVEDWLRLACLLDRAAQMTRSALRQCAEKHDLTDRQLLVLWLSRREPGGSSQVEMAKQLALSPAQLCQLLDRLRKRKLLESVRDAHDRRRQRTLLTPEGVQTWLACMSDLELHLKLHGTGLKHEPSSALTILLRSVLQSDSPIEQLKIAENSSPSESLLKEAS